MPDGTRDDDIANEGWTRESEALRSLFETVDSLRIDTLFWH
jgi:hypothetical protein